MKSGRPVKNRSKKVNGMKKLLVLAMFFASLFLGGPAVANDGVSRDKAYWTQIWYQKQAKRGAYVQRNGKWVRTGKARVRKAAVTRSKRRGVKRRSSGGRVVAHVDLSSQRMTVTRGGTHLYSWPVSSGRKGYRTPTGTYRVGRMHKRYFSRKYDGAPMPYAMFFRGGYAIHGTNAIKRLGRPASHGCVRLHPANAATLFSLVKRHGGTVRVTY